MNNLLKREIESHSSFKTNDRIDEFLRACGELNYIVHSSKPNPLSAMSFFAATLTLYEQTHPEYAEKVNEQIKPELENCIKEANIINSGFLLNDRWAPQEVINLIQLTSRAIFLMVQGLQNLGYFFRHGSQEQKGIDAALEIFQLDIWKDRRHKKEEIKTEDDIKTI